MFTSRKYSVNFVPPRASSNTHGWIVVLGVSLVFIFNTALSTTFGIIFEPILSTSSGYAANLANNIFTIISNLSILATGFLIKDLSAKHFVIIGSSLLFVGLACSAFVVSLSQLIFTYSILCGVGIGLLNPAAFVAVFSCFSASRSHAIGICFAGLGLGQLIMPLIAQIFTQNVSYRMAVGIMSAISLIGVIGANLLAPIKWRSCGEQCCVQIFESDEDEEQQPLLGSNSSAQCSSSSSTKCLDEKQSVIKDIVKACDLDLLMDYNYLIISIGLALVYAVSVDFSSILPMLLSIKMEMDIQTAIYCINMMSIADILTRAIFPFVVSSVEASSVQVFLLGVAGISIAKVLFLYLDINYFMLMILCMILVGIFKALTVVNQVLIIDDFCKNFCPRRLPGMLGLSYVIKSIFLFIFGLIFNSLASISIDATIHIYSHLILQLFVILIWIFVLLNKS